MRKSALIMILGGCFCVAAATVKTDTTRGKLQAATENVEITNNPYTEPDSVRIPDLQFKEGAITIKGFNKRAGDNKETFFVTNNSIYHVTQIRVTFRYSDMKGNLLHERTVNVQCDVNPGGTAQASVSSFDNQHMFYYFLSGKSRNNAVPFKVSAKIMRYDIAVERR